MLGVRGNLHRNKRTKPMAASIANRKNPKASALVTVGPLTRLSRTMLLARIVIAMLIFPLVLFTGGSALQAADCEDTVARHMVGEALLAANFVALAEKAGMTPDAINAILKNVAEKSAIQEFWI